MRRRNRITFLSTFLALLLFVAGCGTGGGSAGTDTTGGDASSDPGNGEDSVELSLWHAGTPPRLTEGMEALVEAFEEANPNVSVSIEVTPFEEYFQKVATAMSGGEGPDVFWVDVTYIPEYAAADILLPLDEIVGEEELEDFYPSPRADMTYDGTVRSIPMHQSTEALVYRTDVVEELGVTVPPASYEEGWTSDEFLTAAKTAVEASDEEQFWGYTLEYGVGLYGVQPWVAADGGALIDDEHATFSGYLDSPETAEAMNWYADLFSTHEIAPLDPIPDLLANGQSLFHQANPFVLSDLIDRRPELELAVAPLPCKDTCAVATGGWHIGANAATDHPEEALALTEYIGSTEGQLLWTDLTRYVPSRISVAEQSDWLNEELWAPFFEGLEDYPVRRPVTVAYGLLEDEFGRVLRDAMIGGDVTQEALSEVATNLDAEHSR